MLSWRWDSYSLMGSAMVRCSGRLTLLSRSVKSVSKFRLCPATFDTVMGCDQCIHPPRGEPR
jgi:hypothetical protein